MSGKQDKESRRVKQSIDKLTKRALLDVEAERRQLTPLVIAKYNKAINELSLRKRVAICWRIIRGIA